MVLLALKKKESGGEEMIYNWEISWKQIIWHKQGFFRVETWHILNGLITWMGLSLGFLLIVLGQYQSPMLSLGWIGTRFGK